MENLLGAGEMGSPLAASIDKGQSASETVQRNVLRCEESWRRRLKLTPEQHRNVAELFDQALEKAPDQRAAFLAQACAGNPELLAAVQRLLASDEQAVGFLSRPAIETAAAQYARQGMGIPKGTRVGHYKVVAELGAGGMGHVYHARDTRLGRDVALKFLPRHLVKDAEHVRRFEHEALATSALNHPNILTVFDVGSHSGNPYLVMELLEGETLRARLAGLPLPPRKAIEIGRQVAAGLAAAHAKGIVHRDLKPENLFVTGDARVKILDFGLAKLRVKRRASADTLTQFSSPGRIMGTVAYMSPEQVRGHELGPASDIFSFGLIFFEMLYGRRAFSGESDVETMHAILKDETPEPEAAVAPALTNIVRRCLEKQPERRFHSAHDLALALESLSLSSSSAAPRSLTASPRRWPALRWIAAAAALAACSLLLLWNRAGRVPAVNPGPVRLSVNAPAGATLFEQPALSPDGRALAFFGSAGQIWLREMGSEVARPVAGTEGAERMFWSPDSRWIAFVAAGALRKVERGGGRPVVLYEGSAKATGGAWSSQSVILFSLANGGLHRISAAGGVISPVTTINRARGESAHAAPVFLPDGRRFLFHATNSDPAKNGLYLGSLEGGVPSMLVVAQSVNAAVSADPGHILYVQNSALLARRFDLLRQRWTGAPVRLAGRVRTDAANYAWFSVSGSELVYAEDAPATGDGLAPFAVTLNWRELAK